MRTAIVFVFIISFVGCKPAEKPVTKPREVSVTYSSLLLESSIYWEGEKALSASFDKFAGEFVITPLAIPSVMIVTAASSGQFNGREVKSVLRLKGGSWANDLEAITVVLESGKEHYTCEIARSRYATEAGMIIHCSR